LDVNKVFLDTNILVYANDHRDRQKQATATRLLAECIGEQRGVISTQVLQEYASVAIYKLHQDTETVVRRLLQFESMEVVQLTPALIRRALEFHARRQIHFWDASILAAAELARCSRLWSEDFAAGSTYGLLRVENPLAAS
jgi:predicted nucleic acid-binding protein